MNILEEIRQKQEHIQDGRIQNDDGLVLIPAPERFRRLLAIGDIHGNWHRLLSLWPQIQYQEDDLLVFLGDYIDRGTHGAEVLQLVMELTEKRPHIIALTGNHEAMMLHYFQNHSIREPMDLSHGWLRSGGQPTFRGLRRLYEADCGRYHAVLEFLLSLNHLAAAGTDFIFTHAGFYPEQSYEEQVDDMLWLRTEFYEDYASKPRVIIGHTPVQYFSSEHTAPLLFRNHILDCDTGSFLPDGRVSCIDVRKLQCWQSHPGIPPDAPST